MEIVAAAVSFADLDGWEIWQLLQHASFFPTIKITGLMPVDAILRGNARRFYPALIFYPGAKVETSLDLEMVDVEAVVLEQLWAFLTFQVSMLQRQFRMRG